MNIPVELGLYGAAMTFSIAYPFVLMNKRPDNPSKSFPLRGRKKIVNVVSRPLMVVSSSTNK